MNAVSHSFRRSILEVLAIVFFGADATLHAQVVQLPTYHVFQMPLNVVVPDQGTAVLGGTDSATASRSTRGVSLLGPVSRSQSFSRGSSYVSVSATIIDHRQWDAAILAEARQRADAKSTTPNQRAAERMTAQIRAQRPAPRSVHELTARAEQTVQAQQASQEAEAMALIRHGHECLAKGQAGAARIFFRTAMRQSSGAARQLAQRQLASLAQQ